MRYAHAMIRVSNLEESVDFYCNKLGLVEIRRKVMESGRHTLVFLAAPLDVESAKTNRAPVLELTYNWDPEVFTESRSFGHLSFHVKDIYEYCEKLVAAGVKINRPPRDGKMAFIRSPDNLAIEFLQDSPPLEPKEPWASMKNQGTW
ncbi:MAG: VOC family protein [Pseudomonadota bacterium]